MGYAENIMREILMEEIHQNNVIHAIKRRHEVSFIYNNGDGDNKGKKERITVQPVAYGMSKKNNPCFRAYQINGSSESYEKGKGNIPGWRLFLLSNIVSDSWKESGKIFRKPPLYNDKGDKEMSQVLVQANFESSQTRYERGGLKKYNTDRHNKKVEENPYYDFEKQVNKKNIAPQWVMKNIDDTSKTERERSGEWEMANTERIKQNSTREMSQQRGFGDEDVQQTIGPQRKNTKDNTTIKPQIQKRDYNQILKNGPVMKGSDEINNNEENLEDDES